MAQQKERDFYLWQVYVYQHWQAFSISACIFSKQGGVCKQWPSLDVVSGHWLDLYQLWTWLGQREWERGVRTSVGWLVMTGRVTLGQSDTAIMVTQTQLCIMNRVPGISGIPGRLRRRKPIVISGSHELNVNISQSEDTGTFNQSEDSFLHKICTTIKVKDHLKWDSWASVNVLSYAFESFSHEAKEGLSVFWESIFGSLWNVQRQEIKEDQLMAGLRFMIISYPMPCLVWR